MVDRGPIADAKPLSARAKWLRVGTSAVLAYLAWLSWRWNGAMVGVPVVIGLLIGAVHRFTPLWARARSRRPAWDRLISLVFTGGVVLCGISLWGSPRPSPRQLDRDAVIWVAAMEVTYRGLQRWDARRQRTAAEKVASPPVNAPSDH